MPLSTGSRRYGALVESRITFFVEAAEATQDGWIVTGERGLGPPEIGDMFSFVDHQDDQTEDIAALAIVEAAPDRLRLVSRQPVRLRAGDVLGGVVER